MYSGLIEGIGPRYCPSIEDKVVRFADKESHLFFLEPEGKNTNEIYLQGCSTSLPINIQWQIVNSLPGLERAEIIRPAYAVEYDFLRPIQFKHSLESKLIKGLFAAGQLLGTSGYEEAASQGFMAGINAAKCVQGKEALILKRSESYIGTLLDDLVIKEITEPYRMMTSRSEHRLHLRQDNADRRLTPIGREIGLVDDYRWKCFEEKLNKFDSGMEFLKSKRIKANEKTNHLLEEAGQSILKKDQALTLAEIWSRPSSNFDLIKKLEPNLPEDLLEFEIETEIKYAGYVTRQDSQVEKLNTLDNKQIPDSFDYQKLNHISSEAREKLTRIKPQTIGQASKIDGVRSADINVLLISLAASGKH